jgi:hypothetical protein
VYGPKQQVVGGSPRGPADATEARAGHRTEAFACSGAKTARADPLTDTMPGL